MGRGSSGKSHLAVLALEGIQAPPPPMEFPKDWLCTEVKPDLVKFVHATERKVAAVMPYVGSEDLLVCSYRPNGTKSNNYHVSVNSAKAKCLTHTWTDQDGKDPCPHVLLAKCAVSLGLQVQPKFPKGLYRLSWQESTKSIRLRSTQGHLPTHPPELLLTRRITLKGVQASCGRFKKHAYRQISQYHDLDANGCTKGCLSCDSLMVFNYVQDLSPGLLERLFTPPEPKAPKRTLEERLLAKGLVPNAQNRPQK